MARPNTRSLTARGDQYRVAMSETRGFCPRCGDPVERPPEADLPGARGQEATLCDDCYLAAFDLVDAPERVEVGVCSHCGAVRRDDRWVDVGARDHTDVAVEAVTEALGVHVDADEVAWHVEPEQVDANTIRLHATFTGVVRDTALEERVTVPVYVARETCDRCGRIAGDSFAGVVQVRGTDREPTPEEVDRAVEIAKAYVADREANGDRNAYITEISRTDAGVDLKVSANQLGQAIATRITRELGGRVSESERLITEDGDGNEVYRVTFLARLPPFKAGDIIDPGDGEGPVLVRSVQGNLKGVRLATGERYEASHEAGDAPDARKLADRGDAVTTTLVAVEDDHAVQVLDPDTYESTTVSRPAYLDTDADTVPVVKTRAGLHVLPEADWTPSDNW